MKKIISLIVCCLMLASLCGCGKIEQADLTGTWSGSYEEEGNTYNRVIEFESSGRFVHELYENGELFYRGEGTYKITSGGKKVECKDDDRPGTSNYEYSKGKLIYYSLDGKRELAKE